MITQDENIGDFRIINKHLVLDLELLNLWNDEMKDFGSNKKIKLNQFKLSDFI